MNLINLKEILYEVNERTTKNDQYDVLTSSRRGLINQNAYFNKQVASKNNIGYKIIKKGQFTYRSMSDDGKFYINLLQDDDIGIVSPAYPVFTCNTELINPYYLAYFFKSNYFQSQISSLSTGSTRLALKFSSLKGIKINLPPLEIQEVIVQYLSHLNALLDKNNKLYYFLDELIKSRFNELFGDIIYNEKRWITYYLNEVCAINKIVKPKANSEEVWLLNLDMVESNTGNVLGHNMINGSEVPSSTVYFDNNCVLYSKLRPYLNKVVIPDMPGFATSEMLAILPKEKINKYFLTTLLRTQRFVDYINSTTYGAKMPRANVDDIKKFKLICPPLELQNEFAEFVQLIDKSKLIVQKQKEFINELIDKKMNEYFE